MSLRSLLLISGFILLMIIFLYYLLGGFSGVEYSIRNHSIVYRVIGKEYSGKNNSNELEFLFRDTKNLLKTDFPSGTLVIVNDETKYDEKSNLVGYFIGILLEGTPGCVPDKYQLKKYSSEKVIRAHIESHNLVMPKPGKIRKKAKLIAESEGLDLSALTIEKYLDEGVVEVDFLTEE